MSENVRLISPSAIQPNPENPRMIFREDELTSLADSISKQGILVPLTLYEDGEGFVILDGERRWRCSLKLGLQTVPAIVQRRPERLQNIMMMFAIHNARKDWDPLPTAMKLGDLEAELTDRRGKTPTEAELAASASMSKGEVRRLRRILALPENEKKRLLKELEKPRHLQILTVDHFLETRRGVEQLVKKGAWPSSRSEILISAIIEKFENKVEKSTVKPRVLPQIARAYERRDVSHVAATRALEKLITQKSYSLSNAYDEVAIVPEENRKIEVAARNLSDRIEEFTKDYRIITPEALTELRRLQAIVQSILTRDG